MKIPLLNLVEKDGFKNLPQLSHTFITRPEKFGWLKQRFLRNISKWQLMCRERNLSENNFYPENYFIFKIIN